ncbi:MAG: hypothetical protein K2Y20_05305 [Sphingomonas sp.]|nr:hypothetical protein [Sphingomonas sp.]
MKISALLPAPRPADGNELLPIVQDGVTRGLRLTMLLNSVAALLPAAFRGPPGGSNNTYARIEDVAINEVPEGTDLIWLADEADSFVADATVDAGTVAADPVNTVRDSGGRGFRRRNAALTALGRVLGATLISVSTGAAGETSQTLAQRLELMPVLATSWGLSNAATPVQARDALQRAIDRTPTGGECIVPASIDRIVRCSKLSEAVRITRPMKVTVLGTLRSDKHCANTPADLVADPSFMFAVESAGVRFDVRGKLCGDGSFNDLNAGDEVGLTIPGLIYVRGDDFRFKGAIDTAPKVGIYLVESRGARIAVDYVGGPVVYNEGVGEGPDGTNQPHTGYFVVRASGGGGHQIFVRARPGGLTGGKPVTAVFSGGPWGAANGLWLRGCDVDVLEKLLYGFGIGHYIDGGKVVNARRTDIVRLYGDGHTVERLQADDCKALVTAYDCSDLRITGCKGRGLTTTAINIQRSDPDYTGGFRGHVITDNVLEADETVPAEQRAQAIAYYIEGSDAYDIDISGNSASGFGQIVGTSAVLLRAVFPATLYRVHANDNKLGNAREGIIFDRCSGYEALGNALHSIAGAPIRTINSTGGTFRGNRGLGAIGAPGIAGLDPAVDSASDNQWGNEPLEFIVNLAAGKTKIDLPRAHVAPHAEFSVEAVNDAALLAWAEPVRAAYITDLALLDPEDRDAAEAAGGAVRLRTVSGNASTELRQYRVLIRQ